MNIQWRPSPYHHIAVLVSTGFTSCGENPNIALCTDWMRMGGLQTVSGEDKYSIILESNQIEGYGNIEGQYNWGK